MARVVIVGAGLAGLACAVALGKAGVDVVVLEAARHAGGRCRSFYEKSLATIIDNGNHLLLSGNIAVMELLDEIGARDRLVGPAGACFPFADLATGERWTVSPGRGRVPGGCLTRLAGWQARRPRTIFRSCACSNSTEDERSPTSCRHAVLSMTGSGIRSSLLSSMSPRNMPRPNC